MKSRRTMIPGVGLFLILFSKKIPRKHVQTSPRLLRGFRRCHILFRGVREGKYQKYRLYEFVVTPPHEPARAHTMVGEPPRLQGRNNYFDTLPKYSSSMLRVATRYVSITQNVAIYHPCLVKKRHIRGHEHEAKGVRTLRLGTKTSPCQASRVVGRRRATWAFPNGCWPSSYRVQTDIASYCVRHYKHNCTL